MLLFKFSPIFICFNARLPKLRVEAFGDKQIQTAV